MRRAGLVLAALVAALLTMPAAAQNATIRGTMNGGSNSDDIAGKMESEWNVGGYDCDTGSPTFIVTSISGLCDWRQVTLRIEVPSGGPDPDANELNVDHGFEYEIDCGPADTLTHQIGFDPTCSIGGAACTVPTELPDELGDCPVGQGDCVVNSLSNIDTGTYTFNLSGGDQIRFTTTESAAGGHPSTSAESNVPALGEWGAIVVGLGIVGLAVFLILRRREV